MLNLNYNIIGSIKQEFKATNQYIIRPDAFRDHIVLAVPGNLFKNGEGRNQFGMQNPYDDISAFVRGNGVASGNNVQILISSSNVPFSASLYATSSYVKWDNPQDRYEQSIYLNGINSLVANQIWAAKQGTNLTFDKSFVIESYIGFQQTASFQAEPTRWTPNRIIAWKYDPGIITGSSYLFDAWGGNNGSTNVSGSLRFVWDNPVNEFYLYPTASNVVGNFAWHHYAVAYSSSSRELIIFFDGVVQNKSTIAPGADMNQDTAELLQFMGAVDSAYVVGGYSGSAAVFQDFRVYNGTDKVYSGDGFTPPPSIVTWQ